MGVTILEFSPVFRGEKRPWEVYIVTLDRQSPVSGHLGSWQCLNFLICGLIFTLQVKWVEYY